MGLIVCATSVFQVSQGGAGCRAFSPLRHCDTCATPYVVGVARVERRKGASPRGGGWRTCRLNPPSLRNSARHLPVPPLSADHGKGGPARLGWDLSERGLAVSGRWEAETVPGSVSMPECGASCDAPIRLRGKYRIPPPVRAEAGKDFGRRLLDRLQRAEGR